MKIKQIVIISILLGGAAVANAGTNDLPMSLQRGLFEEEANHQLDAAIVDYKAAIENFDHERQLAATAIFRLGECYRKLGKTNEANAQYERLVREFSDQTQLAQLSQAYLPTGASKLPSTVPETGLPADEEKFLLEVKESVQNSPDLLYDKLFIAVENGYVSAVEFLLTHGADAKRISPALLCTAASHGNEALVELLLKHGAPINAQNEHGITALLAAADSGYATVFRTLLDHGADVNLNTPIFTAVDHNNEAFVKALLEHGALADPVNDRGRTPLMNAAARKRNFDSICQLLLAHGANVNAADIDGDRPLNDALRSFMRGNKSPSLVEFLLTHKADLEATNNLGQTPLLLVSAWVQEGTRRTVPAFQIPTHASPPYLDPASQAAKLLSAKLLLAGTIQLEKRHRSGIDWR